MRNHLTYYLLGAAAATCFVAAPLSSQENADTAASDIEESLANTLLQENQIEPKSWRDRYELGPSDVINIDFYGRPELARTEIRIAPDGTISYHYAKNVPIAGLTIDEARTRLENELRKYFRSARLIITPNQVASKRYFILGKVIEKGVFTLERPITLLEAIARSRGIETGLSDQNTVEVADLDRSFVIRNGDRLKVDMAKLYYNGDLSQNISIEPNDYIYIASNLSNEYYILGEVGAPGTQPLSQNITVLGSLTNREGFTERAYRKKVLLVRGSLENPETIIVNVDSILRGKEKDHLILPGDLIYVNRKPWSRVEEILGNVSDSFVQSATTTWLGANIPTLLKRQLLPDTPWRTDTQ